MAFANADLMVRVVGDTGNLDRAMTRAQQITTRSTRQIDRSTKRMALGFQTAARQASGLLAVLGIAGLAGTLVTLNTQIEKMASIGDFSDRIGIDVEVLQRIQNAAAQSGIAIEAVNMSLQRFTRRVGEAAQGREVAKVFKTLGVEVQNADGSIRNATDVLFDFFAALSRVESEATRVALAAQVLDSEGVRMLEILPALAKGADSLAENFAAVEQNSIRVAQQMRTVTERMQQMVSVNVQTWIGEAIGAFSELFGVLESVAPDRLVIRFEQMQETVKNLATDLDIATINLRLAQEAGEGAGSATIAWGIEVEALTARYQSALAELKAIEDQIKKNTAEAGGGAGTPLEVDVRLRAKNTELEEYKKRVRAATFDAIEGGVDAALGRLEEHRRRQREIPDTGQAQDRVQKAIDDATKRLERQQSAIAEINAQWEEVGETIDDQVASSIQNLINGTMNWKTALLNVVGSLASQFIGNFTPGFAQALPSLFGGGSSGGGVPMPFAAEGGRFGMGQPVVVGEAGPEIAVANARGMTITPLNQGGGGAPVVNIINNSGAEVSTQTSNTAQGPQVDVIVGQIAAKNIGAGGSLDKAIRSRYGLRPKTAGR